MELPCKTTMANPFGLFFLKNLIKIAAIILHYKQILKKRKMHKAFFPFDYIIFSCKRINCKPVSLVR